MYKDIRFDETVCGNIKSALDKEWLETNSLGGYASSTIIGVNTRRYHGLLIARPEGVEHATLFLSTLEEQVIMGDDSFYLSCHIYPDTIHPTGFMYIKEFRLDPFPTYVYKIRDSEIEKTVFMVYGKNTVVVRYRLTEGREAVAVKIRPLVAFRSYHALSREDASFRTTFTMPGASMECLGQTNLKWAGCGLPDDVQYARYRD